MSRLNRKFLVSTAVVLCIVGALSLYLNLNFIERYFLYQEKQQLGGITDILLSAENDLEQTVHEIEQSEDVVIARVENSEDNSLLNQRLLEEFQKKGVSLQKYWLWDKDQKAVEEQGRKLRVYSQEKLNYSLLVEYVQVDDEFIAIAKIIPSLQGTLQLVNRVTVLVFLGAGILLFLCLSVLVHKIIAPISQIRKTTNAIADLRFDTIELHTNDELELLAEDVNKMSVKLQESHELLVNKNRQMEELLANVSHDLKTPIALVKMYASGMKDEMDDGTFLDTIIKQNEKMEQMVEKLLNLAKIKQQECSSWKVNLSGLLAETVKEYCVGQAGTNYQINIDDAVIVETGPEAVQAIFSNTISNAVKYSSDGSMKITLVRDGQAGVLSVENPVDPDCAPDISKIWEPFYVAEESRNKYMSGTGLGLALVKEICDKYHVEYVCEMSSNNILFKYRIEPADSGIHKLESKGKNILKQENEQFKSYKLSEELLHALDLLGYHEPTDIQKEVIPVMLSGKNVVAKAPTGSGKTAAFAIPLCEGIVWEENRPQALVLEPTRELAVQVRDEIFHIGRKKRIKVPAVFGGFPIDKQIQTLRQKSHVVVGTPGRVMDHIRHGSLKLEKITSVVIDEADLMLDMGFIDEVKEILSMIPSEYHTALFSATLQPKIQELVDSCIPETTFIMQETDEDNAPDIVEKLYDADNEHKYELFLKILIDENPKSCMIFCGTREMVNVLFQKMRRSRVFCGMLHGEVEQKERLRTVEAFRRGAFRFLISTDVAARGIDFEGITHVINYDFPTGRETYVHRIGRTGRNGKTGTAVSFVCEEDRRMLRMVEEYTGKTLPTSIIPEVDKAKEKEFWKSQREKAELKPGKGAALNSGITRLSIGGGRKSKMRTGDLVGAICSIEGVEQSDIGIIDIRDSLSYVEILNQKGQLVLDCLQEKTIKGKIRKTRMTRDR